MVLLILYTYVKGGTMHTYIMVSSTIQATHMDS